MQKPVGTARRDLLKATAVAMAALALPSCSGSDSSSGGGNQPARKADPSKRGSETKPLPKPAKLAEAPELKALVDAGKLPPVEERVPESPYVVPHRWLEIGKYGGDLLVPSTDDTTYAPKEYMYGHSLLRWVNDGQDILPGLVESWDTNEDASEWTFHFRKGLKWSDGRPWTTADIMFWWEDMVLDEVHPEVFPDEAISGTGTPAEFTAPDESTLVMTFDSPAPLVSEMIANWVNRGIDATWMEPKHYMQKFHPKYTKGLPSDWLNGFDSQRDITRNPDVPTMNGWQLDVYEDGRSMKWKRNPYYWVVDKEGNQLPYIDTLSFKVVAEPEARRLQVHNGEFDFVHGSFADVTLADVDPLRKNAEKTRYRMIFWDSGSGTGSMFFFNQDYYEPKMRELIRKKEFRQALSHAFNRSEIRKSVYYNSGELTTGAYGPKTLEFHRGDGPSMYKQWRDSFVDYDPEKAKQILDDLGVKDVDGDGKREMPDGSKLVVYLDYPADEDSSGEHMQKNQLLSRNWNDIGIDARLNPVPPTAFDPKWAQGRLMSTTAWEVSTVTLGSSMLWLMPMEPTRWAPLQGTLYSLRGTPQAKEQLDLDPYERTPPRMEPEPGSPVDRLWKLADQVTVETDRVKRDALIWQMVRIHIEDGPFFIGSVANYPQIELVKEGLRNVPERDQTALGGFVNDWEYPMPAAYDPESWFWE